MSKLVEYDRAEQGLVDDAEICALPAGLGKCLQLVLVLRLRPTGKQLGTRCIILYHLVENLRGDGLINSCCDKGW